MNKKVLFTSLACAGLFTVLFYKRDLGLNLLIFEWSVLVILFINKQIDLKSRTTLLAGAALLTSSVVTVINYSAFSYIVHFLSGLLFTGVLVYPRARSLTTSLALSLHSLFASQRRFLNEAAHWNYKGKGALRRVLRTGVFIVPALIVLLFFMMYQQSNPVFERIFAIPMEKLQAFFRMFFNELNFLMIFTFLFGVFICNSIFLRKEHQAVILKDREASEDLLRLRREAKRLNPVLSLKNEYRAAVFLFAALNLLLFLLNVADIYSVWFHFEWDGQYLKQYVHEGTYLLLISILLSILLVLYYFRGNLNHYPKQQLLKTLALIWLAQNTLLVISVAIRNYWYIHYFALAYKRIGVYIFLALTLFGLYSVWTKVQRKKSMFYLCRVNAAAWLVTLVITSAINWDVLIVKYNFLRAGKSFLHLNFLVTLPDKTLPYLDKPYTELTQIDAQQKHLFHFNERFMEPKVFYSTIQKRKQRFRSRWERKDLLEWNFAEWRAYKKLL